VDDLQRQVDQERLGEPQVHERPRLPGQDRTLGKFVVLVLLLPALADEAGQRIAMPLLFLLLFHRGVHQPGRLELTRVSRPWRRAELRVAACPRRSRRWTKSVALRPVRSVPVPALVGPLLCLILHRMNLTAAASLWAG